MEKKVFIIVWHPPLYDLQAKIVKEDFFLENSGFEEEEIKQIKKLEKNQLLNWEDLIIKRIR